MRLSDQKAHNGLVCQTTFPFRRPEKWLPEERWQEFSVVYTPAPGPPYIIQQPTNQAGIVGSNATFTVSAGGTSPLSYNWRLAGTNLPAATNSALSLTNVMQSQAGNSYDVVITNSLGSVTSSPAILVVGFILVRVNGEPAAGTMTAGASATVTISGGYAA